MSCIYCCSKFKYKSECISFQYSGSGCWATYINYSKILWVMHELQHMRLSQTKVSGLHYVKKNI